MLDVKDLYKNEKNPWGISPMPIITRDIEIFKKGTVLDLGCGDGRNALYLAKEGFEVIGVDSAKIAIDTLNSYSKDPALNVKGVVAKLEEFSFDRSYDNVITTFTLHFMHRDNVLNLIREMKRNTSKSGINLIVAFNQNGPFYKPEKPYFYPASDELKALYLGWEIITYEEAEVSTKAGPKHQASFLVARNPSY